MAITNFKTNEFEDAFKLINRNTKRADLKNNALALTIFDKYNTTVDKNGKTDDVFDDNEWAAYQNYLNKIAERKKGLKDIKQTHAMKIFQKRIEKSEKHILELQNKIQEFEKLNIFGNFVNNIEAKLDEKYNTDLLLSLTDKKDIELAKSRGAIVKDISILGRGERVNEEGNWTGTQKYAYIEFPQEMTSEEKENFLKELQKVLDTCVKINNLYNEIAKEYDKLNEAEANLDALVLGYKKGVGTTDEQKQIYNRSTEQNFVKAQINRLLQERQKLWLKDNKTTTDTQNIAAIDNQIRQLENIQYSNLYSLEDNENQSQSGLSVNYTESGIYTDKDCELENNPTITNSHKLDLNYNLPDLNVSLSGEKIEKYITKPIEPEEGQPSPQKFQNQYNIGASVNYTRDNWSVSTNANINIKPSSTYQSYGLQGGYKNFSIDLNKDISTMSCSIPDEEGILTDKKQKSYTTGITLTQGIGQGSINTSIQWSDDQFARIYETGGRYTFNKNTKNNKWTFSATPSVKGGYVDSWGEQSDAWKINAGLKSSVCFNGKNLQSSIEIGEQYTGNYSTGKPANTNTVNVNTRTSYKNITLSAGYMNQMSIGPEYFSRTNSGNFGIAYQSNIGTLEGSYSISKNDAKYCSDMPMQNSWTNTFMMTFSTSFDNLKNLFKHKKEQQ